MNHAGHCEICNQLLWPEDALMVNKKQIVCIECAEKLAVQAMLNRQEIKIESAGSGEPWTFCQECDKLVPGHDCGVIDFDYVCDRCYNELYR